VIRAGRPGYSVDRRDLDTEDCTSHVGHPECLVNRPNGSGNQLPVDSGKLARCRHHRRGIEQLAHQPADAGAPDKLEEPSIALPVWRYGSFGTSPVQLKLTGYFYCLSRPDRPASPSKAIDNACLKFRTPIQVQDACLPFWVLNGPFGTLCPVAA
jgi:hypothetical protein